MSDYYIQGQHSTWYVTIGLEVHAQITSKAKLFSGSPTNFGAAPNEQVSIIDAAMPGMLPVLNKECVRQAVRTGLALGAVVNKYSIFARKNYFYADLPQGYQISQFDLPIIGEGMLTIHLADGREKHIGIERLHLEQDAGKSLHDQHPNKSYIDLNRTGVALMEIVSKPEMSSPEEASLYVAKLRTILQYIGSCDGNMAEGSMRADVNVSVRREGEPLGTRAELKNINSVKFVRQAVEIEAKRQIAILEEGGSIIQETRLFDPNKGETRSMRNKEDAHDYRYFPDPDILPLVIDDDFIRDAKESLVELPDKRLQRFQDDYGLSHYDANVLIAEKNVADYFEEAASISNPKQCANWVLSELFSYLNKHNLTIEQSPVSAINLAGLVTIVQDGIISGKMAKDVFVLMIEEGKSADIIINERGLKQNSNSNELEALIDGIIADNLAQVASYKDGKTNLFGWFVGQVMKATKGSANPALANELLRKKLDS